jgi:two-component system LytT family response regulator
MPAVIFVTAHDDFAVRAFETQALDYLVKPLSEARFRAAMTRVRERVQMKDAVALATGCAPCWTVKPAGTNRIAIATETGQLLIDADEIEWIESEDYYAGFTPGGSITGSANLSRPSKPGSIRLVLSGSTGRRSSGWTRSGN